MAQFGSRRDMGLFTSLNKELIRKYIDTEVLVYKLNLNATSTNVYDEADAKLYDSPILIPSVITIDDQVWNSDDYSSDVTQTGTFAFLRDDLVELDILPEIGTPPAIKVSTILVTLAVPPSRPTIAPL